MKKININKIRAEILEIAKEYVKENGWNEKLIDFIAKNKKFKYAEIQSLFPEGYVSILETYLNSVDNEMTDLCKKLDLIRLKTPERIKKIIILRLKTNDKKKDLIKKTISSLALPKHTKLALKSLYKTIDQIWFIAGDNSTDFNFYTKRAILMPIYSSTFIYWLKNEKSYQEIEKFLDLQLQQTKKIGKVKEKINNIKSFFPSIVNLAKKF